MGLRNLAGSWQLLHTGQRGDGVGRGCSWRQVCPALQTATSQPPVLLGGSVPPCSGLLLKVMREVQLRVRSELLSPSLPASRSAGSHAGWPGMALPSVLNKTEGVSSHSAAFSPLVLLVPACCCATGV